VSHGEGQGQGLRVVLDAVTDHCAGDAQFPAGDAGTFLVQLLHGEEILRTGLVDEDDQIDDRSYDQQPADQEFGAPPVRV